MKRSPLLLVPVGLAFMLLMGIVPTWFPLAPDVVSVAASRGYSGAAAFGVAALWVACALAAGFLLLGEDDEPPPPRPSHQHDLPRVGLALAAVVVLIYFPWFLAKAGPYIEDGVFLTATHRMADGLVPYRDFEFLYGPLMLYPAHWFMSVFGYSMASLYAYIALGEVVVVVSLFALLQALVPERRVRWIAFAVLAVVFSTALFGPNQSGLRRLPAIVALVILASGPLAPRQVLTSALLLGVQFAYSHDFGVAALGAAGMLYAVLLFGERRWRAAVMGVAFAIVSVGAWLVIAMTLLGPAFPDYFSELRYLSGRFSAGEAAFRFYWTVNSVALFALLGLSAAAVGSEVRRGAVWGTPETRLLLLGVGFALIGLRSGLNRADHWHLMPPFLLLMLVWWLPAAANGFGLGRRARKSALALTVVAAATYGFGLLPSISWLAQGWVAGARATITRDIVRLDPPETAAPAIEFERARPDSTGVELARYFAAPQRRGRPVLFYSTAWAEGKQIGVVKRDFLNDDFLYSDERGETARRFLEDHPDAFVLMRQIAWDRLNGTGDPDAVERRDQETVTKRIGQWLSSPHFDQMVEEARLREGRWDRLVGSHITANYLAVARFGEFVVLAPGSVTDGSSADPAD